MDGNLGQRHWNIQVLIQEPKLSNEKAINPQTGKTPGSHLININMYDIPLFETEIHIYMSYMENFKRKTLSKITD